MHQALSMLQDCIRVRVLRGKSKIVIDESCKFVWKWNTYVQVWLFMLVWLRIARAIDGRNASSEFSGSRKTSECIATTSAVTINSQSPVARVLFSPAKYFKGPTSKKTYRGRALDLPYRRIKLKSFKLASNSKSTLPGNIRVPAEWYQPMANNSIWCACGSGGQPHL